jgi:hypothetical protein
LSADVAGGFALVLAADKAYLEYGIDLNIVADRFIKRPLLAECRHVCYRPKADIQMTEIFSPWI